ncbi:zinc finger protein 11-like isoform X2 [Trichoplusia ni]|uniref:Zinc finger protein 11-like isoform X2 n=1 Tax=Trichoplusia ni TaxID=7111 RepID=A0A7E5WUX8_TRINI|nr:zinc finger protein 11-like isoform X2 [Trichoplusia ni]XP_026744088.1 zinc finger protein 11-like isoform X2 [Trichoplusia ni]
MKSKKKMEESEQNQTDISNMEWVKNKLQTVWSSPKFCGLCLESRGNFCSVDMELMINKQNFSKCLQDIINYVFNEDIEKLMTSHDICDSCTEKTIQAYIFIHNTKQLSKIINNCVSDIYSKVNDINEQLDEQTSYENSNVMIVLENDTDLYQTIIDMKSMTEIIPTSQPIAMKESVLHKASFIEQALPKKAIEEPKKDDKEVVKMKEEKVVKEKKTPVTHSNTPNIYLQQGHIVVKPLSTVRTSTTAPRFNTYECADCPDIFTTYRSLKEHEKAKHKKSVFHCKLCDKSYNTLQYLNIHYKTHAKARCKLCQIILPEEELMDHLRQHHKNLVYPCKFCELVYYTQECLDTHFNISHLVNNTRAKSQCIMCLRNFVDSELKKHKCKFACSECFVMPCVHYKYLMSYREQFLSHVNKIKCVDCDYVTRRKEHLIGHSNREHLDHHPFTCADCGQQFYTKLSLKTHLVQFHQDMHCPYCDYEFKDTNTLENHKKACKNVIRAFACTQCKASFDVSEELTKHENLMHNDGVHACKLCKGRFLTNIQLQEHHARVHGGIQCKKRRKHIECSLCDIMFKTIKELLQHEKLHNPDDVYPCKLCSKQFKSLRKLYIHNQRHYTQRTKCSGCNKKVASSFFAQHTVRCPYKNEAVLSHVCEVCGKSFHLQSLLRFHQRVHSEPVKCPYCDKMIKPTSLKRHLEQLHPDNCVKVPTGPSKPSIECELCGHVVRKKVDLEAHMNRYHFKIKPYVCHICSKDFCGRVRLKEHIATHTTDNSCFCSVCGKKFANRVCLKMHFRMHTGVFPYSCDICEQKFRSSSMMKTHRLKQHSKRTVNCPLCDSRFFMVRDMRQHFKKAHWKIRDGRPFDPSDVPELPKEYYHLFEDRRLPKIS